MVVHYSSSNIPAISELPNILSTDLKRRRYSSSKILGDSQLDLTERPSREHYLDGSGSLFTKSIAKLEAKPRRLRKVKCEIQGITEIDISDLLILPLPSTPTGKVSLNNKELNRQKLKLGLIHNLIFEVQGSKVSGMQLEFIVNDLDGNRKLYKTLKDVPGGIYEESITDLSATKLQVGTIPLMRDDFKLEIDENEKEFRYQFIQSNNFLNLRYELISGTFSIYK